MFFRLQNAIVFVEPQISGLHVHAALAGSAVVPRHGARYHGLWAAGQAVLFPELLDGRVLDFQFVFVVQRGEGLAVGAVGFLGVTGEVICDGLFKEHGCLLRRKKINRHKFRNK